jgi:hypothetical protein
VVEEEAEPACTHSHARLNGWTPAIHYMLTLRSVLGATIVGAYIFSDICKGTI